METDGTTPYATRLILAICALAVFVLAFIVVEMTPGPAAPEQLRPEPAHWM